MFNITNICKFDNLLLAYNRLVSNPESTYKNLFRNTYSAYAMSLNKNLKILQSKLKAGYIPVQTIRTFLPKANGLNRMYTLMTVEDQIVYQAYANIIAESLTSIPRVKQRYKKRVFGNLYAGAGNLFFYQKWQDSYKAYTRSIIRAYENGNKYIASFDLTACYDSINHHLLWNLLRTNCHFSDNCASAFSQLLEKWESSEGYELKTGIPQGPQASGIIAEVVLEEYDSYIEALQKQFSFEYFRYVDDIRILANSEETVRLVLFYLDIKSKELGLFPQVSKIAIHQINNIDEEIKRISKPLFDDENDDEKNSQIAITAIKKLMKAEPTDITTIKRYFQFVHQNSQSNKLAIEAVRKFPNMIHSFAFYVQRYPRLIPPSIFSYVYECCCDKTQQFAAGLLLEAIFGKTNSKDSDRLILLAQSILQEDKKKKFIVDSRFKTQLIVLLLRNNTNRRTLKRIINASDWWTRSGVVYQLQKNSSFIATDPTLILSGMQSTIADIALASSTYFLLSPLGKLPNLKTISPLVQNVFIDSGIIQRSRYSNSQITRYLNEIVDTHISFQWKKKLGCEHNQIEKLLFAAIGYWKTDLTAFVNIWDTIDDKICSIVTKAHPELGGYTLGKIGGISTSKKFLAYLPDFHKLCMEIHQLRLSSHLSHAVIQSSQKYTGPIPQQKRKHIYRLIKTGLSELVSFW